MRYKLLDGKRHDELFQLYNKGDVDAYVFQVRPNQNTLFHLGVERFKDKDFLGMSVWDVRQGLPVGQRMDVEYEKDDMSFFIPQVLCDYASEVIVWFKMYRNIPWEYDIWSD